MALPSLAGAKRTLPNLQPIDDQANWMVWRSKGGPDTQENWVLLHLSCYQRLHSQGLFVTKPRPIKTTGAFERLEPDE